MDETVTEEELLGQAIKHLRQARKHSRGKGSSMTRLHVLAAISRLAAILQPAGTGGELLVAEPASRRVN